MQLGFAKGLAGLLIMLIVSAVTLAVTLAYANGIGMPVATMHIVNAMAMSLLLSLVFSTLAFMLIAVGYGAQAAATGISALVGLGGYIIVSLGQKVDWLDPIKIFSPYHYYRPTDILNGHFTTPEAIGLSAVIIIMAGVAWLAFRRRDIE